MAHRTTPTRAAFVVLAALAAVCCPLPSAASAAINPFGGSAVRAPATFAGSYTAGRASLVLQGGPKDFTGVAVVDGIRLAVTATLVDGVLRGQAVYTPTEPGEEPATFGFTGRLTETGVSITSAEGEVTTMIREGGQAEQPSRPSAFGGAKRAFEPRAVPATTPTAPPTTRPPNPLGEPSATPPAPAGNAPTATPTLSGETASFVWPLGLELVHPKEWQRSFDDGTAVFTPPGGGPTTERFLLDFQPAPDVADVNDPSIVAHMDEATKAMHPEIKRIGEPAPIELAGGAKGIRLSYALEDPAINARMDCYILLHRGVGYCFSHVGKKDRVEAGAANAAAVFKAVRLGEPVRDPALVGTWRKSVSATGGPSNPSYSYYSERNVTLAANGTVSEESGMSVRGNGAGATGDGKNADVARWAAGGGVFVLVMPDGETIPYVYKQGGGGLEITPAGGKTQVWFKVQ